MAGKKFGTEFRRVRIEAGKTMADVADALDYSIVYISDIERVRRNPPTRQKIRKMLKAIGKEDCALEFFRLAAQTRQSIEITLKGNTGDKVTNMLVALARRADKGELDDQTAMEIAKLLAKRRRKSQEE
jgi:transcriptional regulator with XRE-family HTH domain